MFSYVHVPGVIATTLQDLQRAVQAGNYQVARQCFLDLLIEPDAALPQVFCEMSVAEYQHGNLRTALTFAEAGEKLLWKLMSPDHVLFARLRNNLLAFYRESGDVSKCIEVGLKWLDELGDNLDPGQSGPICYNIALAYRQRGGPRDMDAALRYYDLARVQFQTSCESAVQSSERDRFRMYEVMVLQNEAWLLCEMGDVARANEYAGQAARLISSANTAQQREQVLLEAYLAYNQKDLSGCKRFLRDFEAYSDQASARQQFWAEWLTARVCLMTEQQLLAGVHSTLAGAEAERSKEVYLMRLAAELDRETKIAG